jgi:hypothetical protein
MLLRTLRVSLLNRQNDAIAIVHRLSQEMSRLLYQNKGQVPKPNRGGVGSPSGGTLLNGLSPAAVLKERARPVWRSMRWRASNDKRARVRATLLAHEAKTMLSNARNSERRGAAGVVQEAALAAVLFDRAPKANNSCSASRYSSLPIRMLLLCDAPSMSSSFFGFVAASKSAWLKRDGT